MQKRARLFRSAETRFANLCADYGARCNQVTEDEDGWDYHVFFPEEPFVGHADAAPRTLSAYVQVKSGDKGKRSCELTLTNALKVAQSRQPWFIVMGSENLDGSLSFFAKHVWKEEISRFLRAARKAELKGSKLNKKRLTITFDQSSKREDEELLPWMHNAIRAVGDDYEQQKDAIYKTVGYESGAGIGALKFSAENKERVYENLLGLGSGLQVSKFTFTPARFGLTDAQPMIDVDVGTIRFTPEPVGPCELRIRSQSENEPQITLGGSAYALALPGLPPSERRFRFSADAVELICSDGASTCTVNLVNAEPKALRFLDAVATLNIWFNAGPIDIQVWSTGRRVLGGTVKPNVSKTQFDWHAVRRIVRKLSSVVGNQADIRISLDDLNHSAPDLHLFDALSDDHSLRIQVGEPLPDLPPRFTSLVYYLRASAGDFSFFAIVERDVREDVQSGDTRRVTCGPARFVYSYALKSDGEGSALIMRDYERYTAAAMTRGAPMLLGDAIREVKASSPKE